MLTQFQQIKYENEQGNELYIMRDDLLPFSMGGNKVRIAEAFFEDMVKEHKDAMIIYGSKHSNLCRVLSNLCCSRGVECVMICSHGEQEEEGTTNNTFLIDWTGTQIVHCKISEIAQTVDQVMEQLRQKGKHPYYIYGDRFGRGNEGTAALAYTQAYQEIQEFEQMQGWEFDYIFCPSGTGATQSGLISGHLLAGDSKKIFGIMISSRETQRAYTIIADGIREYFKKTGQLLPDSYEKEIFLLDDYRLGGYGEYNDEVRDCIRREYRENSLPLDPIYTAKAFLGMKKYIRKAEIRNCRILFLHTGGTPLFYDFLAKEGAVK